MLEGMSKRSQLQLPTTHMLHAEEGKMAAAAQTQLQAKEQTLSPIWHSGMSSEIFKPGI